MQKDFEEDKQQAVGRAMTKMRQEIDSVRKQTDESCKSQYREEMKNLAQKHKEQISAVKKKQWVRAFCHLIPAIFKYMLLL